MGQLQQNQTNSQTQTSPTPDERKDLSFPNPVSGYATPERIPQEKLRSAIVDNVPPSSRAIVVGENHLSHDTRNAVADNLGELSRKGFNVLALELRQDTQKLLDDFSAKRISPVELTTALRPQEGFFGEASLEAFVKVIVTARDNGMKLVAVDRPPTPEQTELVSQMRRGAVTQADVNARGADGIYRRSVLMGQAIQAELSNSSSSKVVFLVGQNHISMDGEGTVTFPNYQPVSYGLLGKGTDSYLQTQGINTTSVVFTQKVNLPPEIANARESSQVQKMMEITSDTPAVVRRRSDNSRGPDLFVLLPAQK